MFRPADVPLLPGSLFWACAILLSGLVVQLAFLTSCPDLLYFLDNEKYPTSNLFMKRHQSKIITWHIKFKHTMVQYYWLMRKINGHPWDAKNFMDLDSRSWHALRIPFFLSSVRCNRAQNRSQCVPLERSIKPAKPIIYYYKACKWS